MDAARPSTSVRAAVTEKTGVRSSERRECRRVMPAVRPVAEAGFRAQFLGPRFPICLSEELVVLVDENDHPIGSAPKLEVHERGLLHRAVSLLLRDDKGR